MRRRSAPPLALVLTLLAAAPAAAQEASGPPLPPAQEPAAPAEWKPQRAEKLGLEWLLPEGAEATEKEFDDGWTALTAKHGEVVIRALVKPGTLEAPTRIEMIALGLTEIPLGSWRLADSGKDSYGWKWYRSYHARHGDVFVIAVLGHGEKGSYLLYVQTTPKDFADHSETYQRWYETLKLF